MIYSQLLDYIKTLSEHQLAMPVVVLVNDGYHELSAALHIDKDFREGDPEIDETFLPYPEDQPILT